MNILEKIKPIEKEREKVDKLVEKIISKLNKKLVAAKAMVGGSYAKDTWLKDNHDIDIFVLFHKNYDERKISNVLEKILKKTFLIVKKVQGSRTYFQIKKGGYLFELIPVIEINNPEEALNIMDISPLHVNWVNENGRELKDEIRKVKAFCKAAYCYGAESYMRSFSGYVLEILTIHYGSFDNFVKNAVKWQENDIIDVKKRKIKILNKSKLSPLVVIDPIQKERNAAAALSLDKFNRFKNYCEDYLRNPSEQFFIKEIKIPENALVLEVTPMKERDDISGAKVLKVYEYILNKLKDFGVKESFWYWDKKAILWYVVEKDELKDYIKHYGPEVGDKGNIKRFKDKWKDTEMFEEDNRVFVTVKRKFTKLAPFLKDLIKDEFLKDKVKKIKIKK